ncbi:MAG TPA: hypothetical protein P5063_06435, partial [Methanomassiliicoccales archaeon]|nr:hypothetical protein [Methanomassiliicoccales archaeon]
DEVREIAIKSSRALIRMARGVVHGMHKGSDCTLELAEAIDEAHRLKSTLLSMWTSGTPGWCRTRSWRWPRRPS